MIALLADINKSSGLLSKDLPEFNQALENTSTIDIEALTEAIASMNRKLGRALTKDERKSRIQKMQARLQVLRYTAEFIPYQDNYRGFRANFEMTTKGIVIEITSPEGESWVESTSMFKNTEANRHFRLSVNSRLPKPKPETTSRVDTCVPPLALTDDELATKKLQEWTINNILWHKNKGYGIYCGIQQTAKAQAWVNFGNYPEPEDPLLLWAVDEQETPPPIKVGTQVLIINKNFGAFGQVTTVEKVEEVACECSRESVSVTLKKNVWATTGAGRYHRNFLLAVGDEISREGTGHTGIVNQVVPHVAIAWSNLNETTVYETSEDLKQLNLKLKNNLWNATDLVRTFFKTVALTKYGLSEGEKVKIIAGQYQEHEGYIDRIMPGVMYNPPSQKPQLWVKINDVDLQIRLEPDQCAKLSGEQCSSNDPDRQTLLTDASTETVTEISNSLPQSSRWKQGWEPGTIVVPSAVGNNNKQFKLYCSLAEIKVKTVCGEVGEIQLLFVERSDGETFSVYGNWVEECPITQEFKFKNGEDQIAPSNPIEIGDKVKLLSTVRFSEIDPNTKLMPNAVLGFEGEIAEVCGVSDNKLALSIGGGETFDYFKSGVEKVDDFDNQTVTDETAEIFTTLDCYDGDWGDEPLDPDDVWSVGSRVQHKKSLFFGFVQGLERRPMLGGYLNFIQVLWDGQEQVEAVEPETLWRVRRPMDEHSDGRASDGSDLKVDSPVMTDSSGQALILISSIRRDGGTQPRIALNQSTIEEYAADRLRGATLPPITVFYDGTDYWLGDGYHRVAAEETIKNPRIRAEIRSGTRRDAILFSCSVNATHGLRRTNADKRRAVETLLSDDEWGKWSNREIAKRAGVDEKTVRNIRESQGAENPHPKREVPRGKGSALTTSQYNPESEDFLVESNTTLQSISHPPRNEVESNHEEIPKPITSVAEENKEWGKSLGIPPNGLPEMPRNEGIEPENYYEKAALLESAIDQVVAERLRLTVSQTNRLMGALAHVCPSTILGHIQLEKLSEFELDSLIVRAQAARSRFDQELLES